MQKLNFNLLKNREKNSKMDNSKGYYSKDYKNNRYRNKYDNEQFDSPPVNLNKPRYNEHYKNYQRGFYLTHLEYLNV